MKSQRKKGKVEVPAECSSESMMRAVETEYNGNRFCSQLEARWAVFFDVIGVEYRCKHKDVYQKFLADFWLPGMNLWVKVYSKSYKLLEDEEENIRWFSGKNNQIMVVFGEPSFDNKIVVWNNGKVIIEDAVVTQCPCCNNLMSLDRKVFNRKVKQAIISGTKTLTAYNAARKAKFNGELSE